MKIGSKNYITLFFLTLFLIFKVTGLHALSHNHDDSNIEHCEICEISTVINFLPLLETETTVLPSPDFFVKQQLNNKALVTVNNNKHLSGYLFTRPPPQSL